MNENVIMQAFKKCAIELTGKESISELDNFLDNLHINFNFDYKKSLSIEAGGSFVDGADTYSCEIIVKINKVAG